MLLPAWEERPEITANLINPAFGSELIRVCADSFKKEVNDTLPFSLAVLVLPLLLNNRIRAVFPSRKTHTIHSWINNHEHLKIDLPNNISAFLPFTKEAIMFGIAHNSLHIDDKGNIDIKTRRGTFNPQDNEVENCVKKAIVLGKILSKSGNSLTIYSILGIKP